MEQTAIEIRVTEELRPAVVYSTPANGVDAAEFGVLVHVARIGVHGGFIVEDEDGRVREIVTDDDLTLVFTDNKAGEYMRKKVEQ